MCGRFTLTSTAEQLIHHFHLKKGVVIQPRYNIAPSQTIPIIKTPGQMDFLKWGLHPHWLGEDKAGFINARVETIDEKPSFRSAFQKRRCLIVTNGYYEWKKIGNKKQPFYIYQANHAPFAFAGIWEEETCAIITQTAEGEIAEIHTRMPVILSPNAYATWLDPFTRVRDFSNVLSLSCEDNLLFYPVTTKVNDPSFDTIECIKSLQS